jgi:hypothetical protein
MTIIGVGCGASVSSAPEPCRDEIAPADAGYIAADRIAFRPRSATAYQLTPTLAKLVMFDREEACREFSRAPDAHYLEVSFPSQVGTHNVLLPKFVGGDGGAEDPAAGLTRRCSAGGGATTLAVGGTVNVTMLRPAERIAGSLDVSFRDGARTTLAFDTCFCTDSKPCSTPVP